MGLSSLAKKIKRQQDQAIDQKARRMVRQNDLCRCKPNMAIADPTTDVEREAQAYLEREGMDDSEEVCPRCGKPRLILVIHNQKE